MISRYDLYTSDNSVYYYSVVNVLKNKLSIKNELQLKKAETEITFAKLLELETSPIKMHFDFAHLVAIHSYIFEDIYEFAGKIRTEDISKSGFKFCLTEYIIENINQLFDKFKQEKWRSLNKNEFIDKMAYYLSEMNVIHPFREGNGRAMREFIREFTETQGYILNWSKVEPEKLMDSMIQSVYDTTELKFCLNKCID